MKGKLLAMGIVGITAIAAAAMYYLQVYAFYEEVSGDAISIELTNVASGQPEPILADNVKAIDADSSPLRFRACFTTPHGHSMLTETYVVYENPVPLTAPGWFDCFNANEVGQALENEAAIAYLAQAEIHDGVDRVVAIFDDGRAFAWHQLNEKYAD